MIYKKKSSSVSLINASFASPMSQKKKKINQRKQLVCVTAIRDKPHLNQRAPFLHG